MRRRNKHDPFAGLDGDFKDAVTGSTTEEIRRRISKVAAAEEENLKAQKDDQQLKEAKQAAKDAGEQYREGTKLNRLRIRWCLRTLKDRGVEA